MSFSAEWLALREPADHAALNPEVRAALTARFAGRAEIAVMDLGCGAGSNLRGNFAALPQRQSWTLVDYDPKLLAAARIRLTSWADRATQDGERLTLTKDGKTLDVAFRQADLSGGDLAALFAGQDLITAAALFDLVSVARIEAVAEAIARAGQTFLTVLTYDGHTRWTPAHPADTAIRDAFNAHQKTDKGFGQAAGPGGTSALAKAFYGRGHRVLRGTSPWIVDERYGSLRAELDNGFAAATRETGRVMVSDVERWLAARLAATDAVSIIGHEDLLAIPG
ncbi:MAG: class I SAM-dependent methyltransferase [Beijerinckiaceae bacterium]